MCIYTVYIYKTMYVDESRLAGILTDVWQLNRHKINKQGRSDQYLKRARSAEEKVLTSIFTLISCA